jgi:hypothetical protein
MNVSQPRQARQGSRPHKGCSRDIRGGHRQGLQMGWPVGADQSGRPGEQDEESETPNRRGSQEQRFGISVPVDKP